MSSERGEAEEIIAALGLQPHPEGGFYRETYRSSMSVRVDARERSASTAIYYLLESGNFSAWHRIASDELWHFYAGSPLNIYVLNDSGLTTHRLGNPQNDASCSFQAVVHAGHWFAAQLAFDADPSSQGRQGGMPAEPNPYALVGCTVAPGFEFTEFELADSQALARQHPRHAELIHRLAPGGQGKPAG